MAPQYRLSGCSTVSGSTRGKCDTSIYEKYDRDWVTFKKSPSKDGADSECSLAVSNLTSLTIMLPRDHRLSAASLATRSRRSSLTSVAPVSSINSEAPSECDCSGLLSARDGVLPDIASDVASEPSTEVGESDAHGSVRSGLGSIASGTRGGPASLPSTPRSLQQQAVHVPSDATAPTPTQAALQPVKEKSAVVVQARPVNPDNQVESGGIVADANLPDFGTVRVEAEAYQNRVLKQLSDRVPLLSFRSYDSIRYFGGTPKARSRSLGRPDSQCLQVAQTDSLEISEDSPVVVGGSLRVPSINLHNIHNRSLSASRATALQTCGSGVAVVDCEREKSASRRMQELCEARHNWLLPQTSALLPLTEVEVDTATSKSTGMQEEHVLPESTSGTAVVKKKSDREVYLAECMKRMEEAREAEFRERMQRMEEARESEFRERLQAMKDSLQRPRPANRLRIPAVEVAVLSAQPQREDANPTSVPEHLLSSCLSRISPVAECGTIQNGTHSSPVVDRHRLRDGLDERSSSALANPRRQYSVESRSSSGTERHHLLDGFEKRSSSVVERRLPRCNVEPRSSSVTERRMPQSDLKVRGRAVVASHMVPSSRVFRSSNLEARQDTDGVVVGFKDDRSGCIAAGTAKCSPWTPWSTCESGASTRLPSTGVSTTASHPSSPRRLRSVSLEVRKEGPNVYIGFIEDRHRVPKGSRSVSASRRVDSLTPRACIGPTIEVSASQRTLPATPRSSLKSRQQADTAELCPHGVPSRTCRCRQSGMPHSGELGSGTTTLPPSEFGSGKTIADFQSQSYRPPVATVVSVVAQPLSMLEPRSSRGRRLHDDDIQRLPSPSRRSVGRR